MSHIVQIQTQVRDPVAVHAACGRLGLAAPVEKAVTLFSSDATGLAVELSGWRYPVLRDPTQKVGTEYGLNGLPTTFVLDPGGNIVETLRGPQTAAKLHQALAAAE